jgi:hypothetical protein
VISAFCDWLGATALSQTFKDLTWFVPLVQTAHILCVAVVVTSTAMTDCKLLGIPVGRQSLAEMVADLMPWVWIALCVLLATGVLLTITEPSRELLNAAFRIKMLMVLGLAVMLRIIERGLRDSPDHWTRSRNRRHAARLVGAVSLLLAASIVVAGRWIAYI